MKSALPKNAFPAIVWTRQQKTSAQPEGGSLEQGQPLDPRTAPGPVTLSTSNLEGLAAFYHDRLGLSHVGREGGTLSLGVGRMELLRLVGEPGAVPAAGTTGLFHFALLLPSRAALARALRHLAENRTPLQGAADHAVSEAIYLADPDGNGIEIYHDKPREEWPYLDGKLRMTNDPLDLEALWEEGVAGTSTWKGLPAETHMGHVHLRVAEVEAAVTFYRDVIGLELTARMGSQAAFLSAGGYHHHIAVNTWGSLGAPPPPPGSAGLREFSLVMAGQAQIELVVAQARAAGVKVKRSSVDASLSDPSQNALRLVAMD